MKDFTKILFLSAVLGAGTTALRAQDCASGYCPENVVVHHIQGKYSAQTVDLTYNFLEYIGYDGEHYCWLDRNIGATTVASRYSSPYTSYGWYYTWFPVDGFPPKYTNDGVTATAYITGATAPNYVTDSDLSYDNGSDVCSILFGTNCVTPSTAEFRNLLFQYSTALATTRAGVNNRLNYLKFPAAGSISYNPTGLSMNISSSYGLHFWTRDYDSFVEYTKADRLYIVYSNGTVYDRYNQSTYYYLSTPRRCIIKL